jgi:hypothetical protein
MTRGRAVSKIWFGSKAKRTSMGCKDSYGVFTRFRPKAGFAAVPMWLESQGLAQ